MLDSSEDLVAIIDVFLLVRKFAGIDPINAEEIDKNFRDSSKCHFKLNLLSFIIGEDLNSALKSLHTVD